jgi:hypothetical protein
MSLEGDDELDTAFDVTTHSPSSPRWACCGAQQDDTDSGDEAITGTRHNLTQLDFTSMLAHSEGEINVFSPPREALSPPNCFVEPVLPIVRRQFESGGVEAASPPRSPLEFGGHRNVFSSDGLVCANRESAFEKP